MTDVQLIAEFEVMLKEKWTYEWGAAKKGVVDCSGAFVYAMKKYGLSIYHGSNTIYRQYLTERGKVGEIELVPGMAVFKWREDGEPDKYIADGLDDFYHIGLYVGGDRVLEAKGTKYGFVESPLKGWLYSKRYQQKGRYYDAGGFLQLASVAAAVAGVPAVQMLHLRTLRKARCNRPSQNASEPSQRRESRHQPESRSPRSPVHELPQRRTFQLRRGNPKRHDL